MLWKVSVNKKGKKDLSSVHLAASSRLREHPQLCCPWSYVWEEGNAPLCPSLHFALPFPYVGGSAGSWEGLLGVWGRAHQATSHNQGCSARASSSSWLHGVLCHSCPGPCSGSQGATLPCMGEEGVGAKIAAEARGTCTTLGLVAAPVLCGEPTGSCPMAPGSPAAAAPSAGLGELGCPYQPAAPQELQSGPEHGARLRPPPPGQLRSAPGCRSWGSR